MLAGENKIQVESVGTLTYGFFQFSEHCFLMSCKVKPIDCRDHLGFVIKSDKDLASCLLLILERGMQRISLLKYPMPADPLEGFRRLDGAGCPSRSGRAASRGEFLRV